MAPKKVFDEMYRELNLVQAHVLSRHFPYLAFSGTFLSEEFAAVTHLGLSTILLGTQHNSTYQWRDKPFQQTHRQESKFFQKS